MSSAFSFHLGEGESAGRAGNQNRPSSGYLRTSAAWLQMVKVMVLISMVTVTSN